MSDDAWKEQVDGRLRHMEARLRALTNLVLSHIVAADLLAHGLAQETIDHAAIQRDAFLAGGDGLVAVYLNALFDDIRAVCDLPPEG